MGDWTVKKHTSRSRHGFPLGPEATRPQVERTNPPRDCHPVVGPASARPQRLASLLVRLSGSGRGLQSPPGRSASPPWHDDEARLLRYRPSEDDASDALEWTGASHCHLDRRHQDPIRALHSGPRMPATGSRSLSGGLVRGHAAALAEPAPLWHAAAVASHSNLWAGKTKESSCPQALPANRDRDWGGMMSVRPIRGRCWRHAFTEQAFVATSGVPEAPSRTSHAHPRRDSNYIGEENTAASAAVDRSAFGTTRLRQRMCGFPLG